MRTYPLPQLGKLRNNYDSAQAWRADCLHTWTTRYDKYGGVQTILRPPRVLHKWLVSNMSEGFTVTGVGAEIDYEITFDSEADAELYRMKWL